MADTVSAEMLDMGRPGVAGAFETIAPAIPPVLIDALASDLADYADRLPEAAVKLVVEAVESLPRSQRAIATGLAVVAVELALRRFGGRRGAA